MNPSPSSAAGSSGPDWRDAIRLDHIAFGVRDASAAVPFLVGELGGRRFEGGPGPAYHFWQWQFARGGTIEVIAPDGPPGGFLHRFLDARGAGLHHVTFKVPDIRAAADHVTAQGYEIVGFNDQYEAWKEAFLHPRQAQGIVVQLAESHPELEQLPEWSFPDASDGPPEPADVLGLRLAARSRERARHQWEETLGGRAEERDGEILFHWRESPLRIAVSIDPDGAEGPRAVEVVPTPGLALPEGPQPVLGAAFVAGTPG